MLRAAARRCLAAARPPLLHPLVRPTPSSIIWVATRHLRSGDQAKQLKELRLVGMDGKSIGVMTSSQALKLAQEQRAELVEIMDTTTPPVWKLREAKANAFVAQQDSLQQGRAQKAKPQAPVRNSRKKEKIKLGLKERMKEVRISDRSERRDVETKGAAAIKFLQKGFAVRVAALNTGRVDSASQKTMASRIVQDICDVCEEYASAGPITGAVNTLRVDDAGPSKQALGIVSVMLTPKPEAVEAAATAAPKDRKQRAAKIGRELRAERQQQQQEEEGGGGGAG